MKHIPFILILVGVTFGCPKSWAKEEYKIEVAVVREAGRIHEIAKTCYYDVPCIIEMQVLPYTTYDAADIRVESLRTKSKKPQEWLFKVFIKTVSSTGTALETSRTLYTTEKDIIKNPLIYQSNDVGRIEVKVLP